MPRNTYQDFRNYDKEAQDLIKNLGTNELYRLYEIVVEEQKRRVSDTRLKELMAVKEAIEKVKGLDTFRLTRTREGYRSSMAQDARAKDGNTRPNRKKA